MGNSLSQRVNSHSSGLSFYFSISFNGYLTGFSNQKSIFIPKHSQPEGLTVIFHETIPFNLNSNYIVFPPTLIALDILYSAPGELWNWNHPKPRDFPVTRTIGARDGIMIPTSPDDITQSEEYTCVVSTKDGYPKMTHFYGGVVVDCHPIPGSMMTTTLGHGNYLEASDDRLFEEVLKHCYICRKLMKQMNGTSMYK